MVLRFQMSHILQAVLVDMEEGVLNSILKGPIGKIFDSKQTMSDNSGSGNNW